MSTAFDLTGRTALVTGASRGLGKEIARCFAQNGADVVIVSRKADELAAALEEILDGTAVRGATIAADLSRRGEAERVACGALAQLGRVDILVSNAGANTPQAIDELTHEAWDDVLTTHLWTAMALTRALAGQMKARGWGRVIYVSSILGLQGMAGRSAYSAAKAALIGLARSAANDLGPFGITVNCIAPGMILTEGLRNLTPEQHVALGARSALGRAAEPAEIAWPVLTLASNAGSFVTGTTQIIDGGWLAK